MYRLSGKNSGVCGLLLTLDGGVLLGSGLLLETRDRIRLRKPGRCGFEASLGPESE